MFLSSTSKIRSALVRVRARVRARVRVGVRVMVGLGGGEGVGGGGVRLAWRPRLVDATRVEQPLGRTERLGEGQG